MAQNTIYENIIPNYYDGENSNDNYNDALDNDINYINTDGEWNIEEGKANTLWIGKQSIFLDSNNCMETIIKNSNTRNLPSHLKKDSKIIKEEQKKIFLSYGDVYAYPPSLSIYNTISPDTNTANTGATSTNANSSGNCWTTNLSKVAPINNRMGCKL